MCILVSGVKPLKLFYVLLILFLANCCYCRQDCCLLFKTVVVFSYDLKMCLKMCRVFLFLLAMCKNVNYFDADVSRLTFGIKRNNKKLIQNCVSCVLYAYYLLLMCFILLWLVDFWFNFYTTLLVAS